MYNNSGTGHPLQDLPPSLPRIGEVSFDPERFHRRARARTTMDGSTAIQRDWLDDDLRRIRRRGSAPWADALLSGRAQSVSHHTLSDTEDMTRHAGPRWLVIASDRDNKGCLRLSTPFARGGQSVVQEGINENGDTCVVRTEYFETAAPLPAGIQPAQADRKYYEHKALVAAESPLLPQAYFGVDRLDGAGADGTLNSVLSSCVASVDELCANWHPSNTHLSVFATQLAIDVGLRLAKLHRAQFGHFDIKPANILLTPQGIFEPADFGFAKPLGRQAALSTVEGSWMYMSPEILLGNALGGVRGTPSDIFSLGLTLLDVLSCSARHHRPFQVRDPRKALHQGLADWRRAKHSSKLFAETGFGIERVQRLALPSWGALRQQVELIEPQWCPLLDLLLHEEPSKRCNADVLINKARELQRHVVASQWLQSLATDHRWPWMRLVKTYLTPWATPLVSEEMIASSVARAVKGATMAYRDHASAIARTQARESVQAMPLRPPTGMIKSASYSATKSNVS